MLINNAYAIWLRNRADAAKRAHKDWEKIDREIEETNDKIDLLTKACAENPFVAAVAPVADIRQYFEDLLVKRHVYAKIEREALLAMQDLILDLVPLNAILGDEVEEEILNEYQ